MKVKYLKIMHNANVGDVLEVTDFEANILIKTGVVEEFKEPEKKLATKTKAKTKAEQE